MSSKHSVTKPLAEFKGPPGWTFVGLDGGQGDTKDHPQPKVISTFRNFTDPKRGSMRLNSSRALARGRGKRPRVGKRRKLPNLPQQIEYIDVFPIVRRFKNTSAAATVSVSRTTLCSTLGVICTVANTNVMMFHQAFRLVKIIAWPAVGSSATSLYIDTYMAGGAEQALVRESIKSNIMPDGVTDDRPLQFVPKKGSYLAMWQNSAADGSDVLLNITAPAGSVLEMHVVATHISGVGSAPGVLTTTATIAQNAVGYMPLDGTNKFPVLGLQNVNH